jgi:hypothetical protein
MSLTIQSGGSVTIQGGSGGGGGAGAPAYSFSKNISTFTVPGNDNYGDCSGDTVAATVTVPSSGKILLSMGCSVSQSGGVPNTTVLFSVAASGANSLTAQQLTDLGYRLAASPSAINANQQPFSTWVVEGLTPGSTTFTWKARGTGNTGAAYYMFCRNIIAQPVT